MANHTEVRHDPDRRQYELLVDGDHVGECTYHVERDGTVVFDHTGVDTACRGQGLGEVLVRGAVEDARASGHEVRGACSFVAAYLERESVGRS